MTDLFTNPHRYGDLDAWRREAVELHARGPIHRIEQPGYQPFWAVIGHDAVLDIERRPAEFTNGPEPVLGSDEQLSMRAAGGAEIRTLIHMDEPDHGKYRKLTNDWFKPASVRRLTDRLDELSRQAVDKLEALGGEADFYKGHRRRLPPAGHPVDPRPAGGRLPEDDQAHPGAVRRRRPRPATRRDVA